MKQNKSLIKAKIEKNDEFYTSLDSIESELYAYKDLFKGQRVFCNCDDINSEFKTFFRNRFDLLGLKSLICIGYNRDFLAQGSVYRFDGKTESIESLTENGAYDTLESLSILKNECDIVVTNPPFSLFREFIKILMDYKKKFLIIGNLNAVTYKEVFPLIKNGSIWLGTKISPMKFKVPDGKNGKKWENINMACWFTNLEHNRRREEYPLFCRYKGHENEYPKFDSLDAINVNKSVDIPRDYDGIMGVPISFLDKLNPEQFEIIGDACNGSDHEWDLCKPIVNGKHIYKRLLIRKIKK